MASSSGHTNAVSSKAVHSSEMTASGLRSMRPQKRRRGDTDLASGCIAAASAAVGSATACSATACSAMGASVIAPT